MRLSQFQAEFAAALHTDTQFKPAQQGGFQVYRNTVMKGCIDALRANFPTVERLTGPEWFTEVAALYARQHRPVTASLMRYGGELPAFLAGLEAIDDLPYLPDVARLDLMWLQAHTAADESTLTARDLQGLTAPQLGALRLRTHASACWAWFELAPAFTIWDVNRRGVDLPMSLEWREEGALLVRRVDEVVWRRLDQYSHAFLDACQAGQTVAEAALTCGAATDAAQRFASLLAAGAFAANLPS